MYKAKVNQQFDFDIDLQNENFAAWDIIAISEDRFHILKNNRSYTAIIVHKNLAAKSITININGHNYMVILKDKMDLLLEKMGIAHAASNKINQIKAPMPGLVLDIKVAVGDSLQKGDAVLVLEAMKMENVLKAQGEGTVKSIDIQKGDAVEKGQLLICLE